MAQKKSATELLRDKYGLNLAGYQYILPGAEILRYIGQNVVYVHYAKLPGDEENWDSDFHHATILECKNFDPMTMTYDVKFQVEGEEEPKEMKIIPEGYSWTDKGPDEAGEMSRFVPLSIHAQMGEDSRFFERVGKLYNERKTLTIDQLTTIATSKGQAETLRYTHNIGAAVKLNEGGDYLWIRIHKISLNHRNGDKYSLKFSNADRSWALMISSDQETYDFEGLGEFKIIDLAD